MIDIDYSAHSIYGRFRFKYFWSLHVEHLIHTRQLIGARTIFLDFFETFEFCASIYIDFVQEKCVNQMRTNSCERVDAVFALNTS